MSKEELTITISAVTLAVMKTMLVINRFEMMFNEHGVSDYDDDNDKDNDKFDDSDSDDDCKNDFCFKMK